MSSIELVVAVRRDDEHRSGFYPATHQTQHVERSLIGSVDVLEHENRRRSRLQLLDECGGHLMRPRPAFDQRCELAPGRAGDVEQRAEWTGREERVACTGQETRRLRMLIAEGPHERRFPYTSLAADEYQPAAGAIEDSPKRIL